VNVKNEIGVSALWIAAGKDKLDMLELLVQQVGAKPLPTASERDRTSDLRAQLCRGDNVPVYPPTTMWQSALL
jgi:hypothetical protein